MPRVKQQWLTTAERRSAFPCITKPWNHEPARFSVEPSSWSHVQEVAGIWISTTPSLGSCRVNALDASMALTMAMDIPQLSCQCPAQTSLGGWLGSCTVRPISQEIPHPLLVHSITLQLSGWGHLLTLTVAALRYSLTPQTPEDQTTGTRWYRRPSDFKGEGKALRRKRYASTGREPESG